MSLPRPRKHRVAIALGSNQGDRLARLQQALEQLLAWVEIEAVSGIYETLPEGPQDQPCFLNAVAIGTTDLDPRALLERFKELEARMGRHPGPRWGPRPIDLDLLLYDQLVVEGPELQLPHPRMHQRAFVLVPLAEIAGDWQHPRLGRTVRSLAARVLRAGVRRMLPGATRIGSRLFFWGTRTYVMGILNITPDSFSGDGLLRHQQWVQAAVEQARRFLEQGAHLLDVGGESTRPGSRPVDAEEEKRRVLPVIEALAARGLGPISVDTYKAEVARAALEAGADLVNDVWALQADPKMAAVVAEYRAPVVLMDNRARREAVVRDRRLGARYEGEQVGDIVVAVRRHLQRRAQVAHQAGIPPYRIILDPGIGFGKTVAQNLELIHRLDELQVLGYPLLVGPSRKSFIGFTLDLPVDQRLEGTLASVVVSILRGADIVRVHDVQVVARAARMTDALVRRLPPPVEEAAHLERPRI